MNIHKYKFFCECCWILHVSKKHGRNAIVFARVTFYRGKRKGLFLNAAVGRRRWKLKGEQTMKTTKILSLVLAVLMVLSVFPLSLISVFAADGADNAGQTGGNADEAVLGEKYTTEVLFENSVGVTPTLTDWFSSYTGAVAAINKNAGPIMREHAKGIMFTIDATQAANAGALGLTFCLSLSWDGGSTYISPTPWGAGIMASSGTVSLPEGAVSNWYISKNGANWEQYVVNEGSKRYASLSLEKDVYYVYVPMTEFWAKVAAHTYPFTMSYVEPIKHFSPQHAAVLYGKPVVAGESYTGYGLYSDAPFDLKPYGDRAFAHGISRMVLHSYVHQPTDAAPGLTLGIY